MNIIFNFEDVFRGRLFKIPDYQRGYAWEKKNWDDLIQDLELLPEGRNHFVGTLVLLPANQNGNKFRDESGATYASFDVIDGQQRLTTIVVFLDAIHDEMERLGLNNFSDGLERNYLTVNDLNEQPFTKLTLNRDCQDYFYNNVLGFNPGISGPRIRSHRLLQQAHNYFAAYLGEQCKVQKDNYPIWLRDLYFKVTQHLNVLLYEVENDTDAGVIFETMNDRGKPLTELEKVKNYLLYIASKLDLRTPHNLAEKVNLTWTHIFEELMAAELGDVQNEDQLLRMHWLMAYDYNPKNWANSRSIKEKFSLRSYQGKHAELLDALYDYLESLHNAAIAYCDIRRPNREGAFNEIGDESVRRQIIDSSEKLARLGARVNFLPLLIAVRLKAKDGGKTYQQVVELCEKVDFRLYQWIGYRSFAAQSTFFHIGNDYYKRPDTDWLLATIARTAHNYCTNEQFTERFDLTTENWYAWGGLKYFLYEYEQHLAQAEHKKPHYLWDELTGTDVKRDTIEHIMPQSRIDSYWKRHFSQKEHERWVNDIGNLTLTYDNSSLGAKAFTEKKGSPQQKSCYASSMLFIEHELVNYSDWTEAEIQKRREQIREWSLKRWRVEAPPAEPGNGIEETAKERLLRLAEENGTLEEFQALYRAAHSLPTYLRMQRNWNGFGLAPMTRKINSLIWIHNDLQIWIVFRDIEKYLGIPTRQAKAILGEDAHFTLEPEEVDDFIARLIRLFAGVRSE